MNADADIARFSAVEKLAAYHDVTEFHTGKRSLDLFLKRHALKNQEADSSQTYVVHRAGNVVGYYSLSYGEVAHDECPEVVRSGMPAQYAIPVMVFARLAVDRRVRGRGLGKALLKDAFLRTVSASAIAGLRAIIVHAIDEEAKAFYSRFGFQDSPTGQLQLMMPIEDVRAALCAAESGEG